MNVLKCTVRGNGIAVVGGEMPVVGSCNYDRIRFQFDGDWDGYYKVAYFWQEENEKIGVALDVNYEAEIPYANLDPALTLKLAVKGYTSADDLTVMRSTHTIGLKLYEGADGNVGNVGGVPDLYEQILGQVSGLAKKGVLTDCHAFEEAGVYAVANGAKNIPPVQMYSGDVATLIVSDAQNVGSGYRYQLAFFYTTSGSGCIYFKQMKEDLSSEYGWIRIDKVPPSIINNLISTSTTSALSAAQGKILNEKKVDKEEGKGLSTNDYTDEDMAKVKKLSEGVEANYTLEYAPAGSGVIVSLKKDGNPQSYFCLNGRDGVTVTAPSETGNPIYISAAGKLNSFDYDSSRYNADTMLEPGVYPGSFANPQGYPFTDHGDAMPILIVMETGTRPMMVDGTYDFSKAKTIMQVCFGKNGEVYSRHKIAQDTGTVADWAWSAWATKDISVLNSLTSTSTTAALSAAQGKFLNEKKVDKVPDKGLSTNDYTDADKAKVATIDLGNYGAHVFTEEDLRFAYIPEELRYRNFNLYYKGNLLSEGADYQISADQTMVDTYGTLTPAPVAGDSLYFVEKKSDKYELIKTITVTVGSEYVDKQEFEIAVASLKEMAFKATVPTAKTNSIFVFQAYNGTRNDNTILNSTSIGAGLSDTGTRYLQGRIFADKGYWASEGSQAMGDTASSSAATLTSFRYAFAKTVETYPSIDVVVFRSNTVGTYIPVGTVIELWGVKA